MSYVLVASAQDPAYTSADQTLSQPPLPSQAAERRYDAAVVSLIKEHVPQRTWDALTKEWCCAVEFLPEATAKPH